MTSDLVGSRRDESKAARELSPEQAAAAAMVAEAKARGLALTGPNGLLKVFTKNVLETALSEEMTEHLGYEKNGAEPGRDSTNVRNGTRSKTVVSDAAGEARIEVPRDRNATFEPQIVKKRQRRLGDVDEIVVSLYAKGLTTGEISAHFAEIYGASVSRETISRITDKVVAEMNDWANRPLDSIYVAVFIDAIHVKVRDGQVANRPVYAAIGVTVDGHKDVLGMWMGTGGEGAKFWMSVLVDLKTVASGMYSSWCATDSRASPRSSRMSGHEPLSKRACVSGPQYLPAEFEKRLGCDQTRCKIDLHSAEPRRRAYRAR
jgi:putative transposase